ncbi:RNA polymerase sigma factor [Phenylobacterium sp.]|uniref:RNA polymerase sigma factor n=2 Tax=Phenylobacterium sp. TaxID=1871053 RepID=UPI0019B378B2|nr:RNA polymerase sigma factor [Phenylobacterium sp.]
MYRIDAEKSRWFMVHILPHEPALRGWLARRTSLGLVVDDVIQETYAILAARESVADIHHPRAYLFQVARSVVTQHVRRSRVVSIQAVDDLDRLGAADDAPSPEQQTVDRDELRRLAEAIAALPPQTRQAFTLRRVHGLPQREIARRMRLSENTVEKHIARGLKLLIDWYARGGKDPAQASKDKTRDTGRRHGPARNSRRH